MKNRRAHPKTTRQKQLVFRRRRRAGFTMRSMTRAQDRTKLDWASLTSRSWFATRENSGGRLWRRCMAAAHPTAPPTSAKNTIPSASVRW